MHLLPLLTVTLSSFAALGTSIALPSLSNLVPRLTPIQMKTDTILLIYKMETFLKAKRERNPPELNWTDNGCTIVPDRPLGFNFNPSCQRHDFGYINYRNQRRCTDADRLRIDNQFLRDMTNQCEAQLPGLLNFFARGACLAAAGHYYNSVRLLAGPFFCGPLSKRMIGVE